MPSSVTTAGRAAALVVALAAATIPFAAGTAQQPDTTRGDTTSSATPPDTPGQPPAPAAAAQGAGSPDFSGVLYANFQYGGPKGSRSQNRFDVDRVYLTARGAAGTRVSYRVTADIFQQRDDTRSAYYGGWAYRLKYAYGQYDFIQRPGDGLKANVRLGSLHTPIVDYEEQFWPRGLSQIAIEQAGFFSSADLGAATLVTFPRKLGELYLAVVDGGGYTQRETDRFKDVGARLTITPFAASHGLSRTLAFTPWFYKGERASDFAARHGTVLPVARGRRKDRYGVHLGIRDPNLTLATQLGWRRDVIETADTTVAMAPATADRDGRVISAYTIVRPLALAHVGPAWPISVLFRFDEVKPDTHAVPYQRDFITGIGWEINRKASVWLDAQSQEPLDGSSAPDLRTYFLHAIVNF